ncbi:YdbL family protein [Aliiglaciecola sp. CAU 1673]|uniref:YdbL family protein n=1 Tax=Aliiglaciecola sp. CAU 1673 TaxID=3032595 RepID=UPI0023DAEBB2|nr:YdbL family protein [Aliiglaciecola sp. CAU 1673]MDF2178181.1 YdbL family protein [Aliiglaciecola sp. CAU 1673]
MKKRISLLIALLFSSFLAFALELDQAKDQGLVGEQPDGYLGVIKASKDVQALVNDINAKRKEKYLELANQNNLQLSQVEALAGKKAVEKTQTGHYVKMGDDWIKK